MRKLVRSLIYQKWFYAFLAVVLWFDCWKNVTDVIEAFSPPAALASIRSTGSRVTWSDRFLRDHLEAGLAEQVRAAICGNSLTADENVRHATSE